LPKGHGWYDLYSGKWYAGGQYLKADAPYEKMPLFVKEGSIIPFGPALQYTNEKPADTIILNVYGGKDALFNLYEDNGTTYDYEKGSFSNILMNYNEQEKSLSIADRSGSFARMIQKRVFIVNLILKNKPMALDFNSKAGKVVTYEGKRIKVLLNK
jgi:alpha-D-xyloside xylohydrolase